MSKLSALLLVVIAGCFFGKKEAKPATPAKAAPAAKTTTLTNEQALSIYAVNQGYMDKVDRKRIVEFEEALQALLDRPKSISG